MTIRKLGVGAAIVAFVLFFAAIPVRAEWFKGNLHMHSQWSDGTAMPEYAVAFYKERGYQFIVLSDHNIFQADTLRFDIWGFNPGEVNTDDFSGETSCWKAVTEPGWPKLAEKDVAQAAEKFGADSLMKKVSGDRTFYRLKTFDELSAQFNEEGKFLMIPGFESTGRSKDGHEVHMNCINVRQDFPYLETANPETTLRQTFDKASALYANNAEPWLFMANHPLWPYYDFSPEDILANPAIKFFELNNNGATFPLHEKGWTPEKFWDAVNAFRCLHGEQLLYTTGTDDRHGYDPNDTKPVGYTVVDAEKLCAASIIDAMNRGDYYVSNGLAFDAISFDPASGTLSVKAAPADGKSLRIDFIGTKKNFDQTVTALDDPAVEKKPQRTIHVYSDSIGVVLKSVAGTEGSYTLAADDLYVRARVLYDLPDGEQKLQEWVLFCPAAWTQPYRIKQPASDAADKPADGLFEVGVATADITPPMNFPISGYYHERLSDGVLDPLLAKALVFRQNNVTAALVVCDVISLPTKLSDQVRQAASEATGIPFEAIAVTATHTHTGPLFCAKSANYEKELVVKIAAALVEAQKNLRAATIETGSANVMGLSFIRRFHMKEGPVVFNPGVNNPNVVAPAAGIDPECGIALFKDVATGKPFASLTSFALHLDTTGGTKFSADYPFYVSEVLKKKFGDDFISVFGTGTCGDINHIDVIGKTPRKNASEIGTALGEKIALRIDSGLEAVTPSLAVAEKIALWPRQQFTEEQVAEAKEFADTVYNNDVAQEKKKSFLERVEYGKILNLHSWPPEVELRTLAIRLADDLAFVTIPGEVFVDIGLAIKAGSPFARTMVIELSQSDLCYVPTEKAFAEGSYETINSVVKPGGGEKLTETAIEALQAVK